MRILPLALIAIGVFELLKYYGLIDPASLQLFWPVLLIGLGVVMLLRRPRWRADMRERMRDRWEQRMQRHFGPGWANLSQEERERFLAGMRQWRSRCDSAGGSSSPRSSDPPPSPGAP
jgi:hypothetical protein